MQTEFTGLESASRVLIEAELKPLQGERFQATGFADLGPARYQLPDGTEMLLVESAQSMANRLEAVCWDEVSSGLIEPLRGLPYIRVNDGNGMLTNSVLEAHRVNSPYILEGADKAVADLLKKDLKTTEQGAMDLSQLALTILKLDPNSILHGLFLAKKDLAGGRLRMARLLSGFIEARNVRQAESGGVKNDRVNPAGDAKKGFGNVPFHRTEFTADPIVAYFNFDLALLRGYRLPHEATDLLIGLGLYKIRRLLGTELRLRTACDLQVKPGGLKVTRPVGFELPAESDLAASLKTKIQQCKTNGLLGDVMTVNWKAS